MATLKIYFDRVIECWWQQCCIFLWQSILAVSSDFHISLCGMLQMPADVRTIISYSLSNIDPAMLLGQCFLFWISGLFLSSTLEQYFEISHFSVCILSFPTERGFCGSSFFPKWPGSYFQKPSRLPFPEDYIKTWVILLFLSASANMLYHTCHFTWNTPAFWALPNIRVNTPSALQTLNNIISLCRLEPTSCFSA